MHQPYLLIQSENKAHGRFRVIMVYLKSSSRPMHEILAPSTHIRKNLYGEEFVGMMGELIPLEELSGASRHLHADIRSCLRGDIAAFLLSLHNVEPDFRMIGLPGASKLSAIRWKLLNLTKLKQDDPRKHIAQRDALESLLG